MIDREVMARIRTIKARYDAAIAECRDSGFGEAVCKGLASDIVGEEAVNAVVMLLQEIDREDDLK